jgi:hypothetical protein
VGLQRFFGQRQAEGAEDALASAGKRREAML